MNTRGLIIVSTLFGLFALSFGVLGLRALTLGPDPAQPSAAQVSERVTAANTLERQIAAARAEAPPALPPVPDRAAHAPAEAPPALPPVPDRAAQAPAGGSTGQAPGQRAPEAAYVDDDEREYEEDEDDHEEGDDDDD